MLICDAAGLRDELKRNEKMKNSKAHVFISYGRKDATDFARKLATWLRAQGFEPWLDIENGIPIGAAFDIQIEMGISGSDVLIALLSQGSLRTESFCRNELLFAQAKGIPILPVRIANVMPPVTIVSLNYLDVADNPDAAFDRLSAFLEEVVRTGRPSLRDWPDVDAQQPWWTRLRPQNSDEELARHGNTFVGREWLFSEINDWIGRPESRLLLLTADAGVGKSAIAAQMTARLNVKGIHFCSRSITESCDAADWLKGLI